MRRLIAILATMTGLVAVVAGAIAWWRRNPRFGTAFVNTVVNPWLLRRGLAGGRHSELGTLEHYGRTSGVRRLTLVHPEPTAAGFRIVVPLGTHCQWTRNVVAAGHCRLQVHETVYELDEPNLVPAGSVDSLPWPVRRLMAALGFQYLTLRTFAANRGALEPVGVDAEPAEVASVPEPVPTAPVPA